MKWGRVIGLICVGVTWMVCGVVQGVNYIVDDSYYWPKKWIITSEDELIIRSEGESVVPSYNKTKEFIFIEDSTDYQQHPDTVKMIIRNR